MKYVYVLLMDGTIVGVAKDKMKAMVWQAEDPARRKFHETTYLE